MNNKTHQEEIFSYSCDDCGASFELSYPSKTTVRCPECLNHEAYLNLDDLYYEENDLAGEPDEGGYKNLWDNVSDDDVDDFWGEEDDDWEGDL